VADEFRTRRLKGFSRRDNNIRHQEPRYQRYGYEKHVESSIDAGDNVTFQKFLKAAEADTSRDQ
jgi:hypothetical protein